MARPKGVKNKPKETVSPQLAKLTAIAMDPSQDAETRADAATALQAALTPTVTEPQALPAWWNDPDPWSDNPAECARHTELWRADPRNPKNKPQPVATPDDSDFSAELDAIEKELFV